MIHLLDSQTIDQIAAGEVIERPVSVVKELVENALDAGADRISVELKAGGLELIRVRDNGCGIPAEQVPIAFARHATSKIDSADDLFALSSLGFRGEALSSIAAVARVELITKTKDSLSGFRYVIEGGEEKCREETGASEGTEFIIRDLFYNVPVRRKFLKSASSEAAYVTTLMEQLALCRPGIAMELILDGRMKLQTTSSYRLKDILYTLYGRETAGLMQPFSYEANAMRLEGYIGAPALSRGNRGGELTFVNGRFVKSPLLLKAIEQAYHGLTMQHRFPMAVLYLTMEPSLLDVNVHPTKMEIRFRQEKAVFDLVYRGIREALFSRDQIPAVKPDEEKKRAESADLPEKTPEIPAETLKTQPAAAGIPVPKPEEKAVAPAETPARNAFDESAFTTAQPLRERPDYRAEEDRRLLERLIYGSRQESSPEAPAPAAPAEEKKAPEQLDFFTEKILAPEKEGAFRLIGQVFETYWLIEYEDQLLLADQHAVHEKILFERTMKSLKNKAVTSQQLEPSLLLTLTARQSLALEKAEETLKRLGFVFSSLGGREISVSAVPGNLFSFSAEEYLMTLLDELGEERVIPPSMLEEKVALMSCKAAVKGNQKLSFAEAEALFKELLQLDNPYACPHGRPTLIRMSRRELEKKFKRIV